MSELTGRAIQKTRTYLENDIDLLEDLYELALVGYALQITESPRVAEVMNKLNAKATIKGIPRSQKRIVSQFKHRILIS